MNFLALRLQMLWLRVPGIGGLARLSMQQTLAGKWDGTWRDGELQLCHMFKGYLNGISRDAFNDFLTYLGKSGDAGRTPAPAWLKFSLAAAVVLESMALSYALFPELRLAPATGNTAVVMALGVASLVGLALLYFMYQAGGQAYRNHVIRSCVRHHARDEIAVLQGGLAEIQAHQSQAGDDADPPQIQRLRRTGSETGMQSILIAAVLLLAVAGYSTLVHLRHPARFQVEEGATVGMREGRQGNTLPDLAASPANPLIVAAGAGIGADMVFGMLFLLTQMIAASIGYRHQLAGKQGNIAYEGTRGYATYEEFFANRDGLINHWAEYWLKELQSAGQRPGAEPGGPKHHSFREFLFLTRQDEIKYDLQNIPHRESKRDLTASRVESILARIAELKHLNRRADAITLVQDLPEPEKTEVKARLQVQSAPHADEISRRAAERQELEKIL